MIIEHIGIEGTIDLVPKYHTHEQSWPRSSVNIPKVAGSIPTVVRLTSQPARCGYTLRVT
jgi:hypothetical protein